MGKGCKCIGLPQQSPALTAAVAYIFGLMKAQSLPHSVLVTWMVGATPSKMGMEMLGRWPGLVTQVAPTAEVMARVQLCKANSAAKTTSGQSR